MSQISITSEALRELRDRIARDPCSPCGVFISGPIDSTWPTDSVEETYHLERLYGPYQRWQALLMPMDVFDDETLQRRGLYVEDVSGVRVGVFASGSVPRLKVELHGDAILIYEIDA